MLETLLARMLGMQGAESLPQTPPIVPEPDPIEVQNRLRSSDMREGLVRKGPFSMGRTGGNILGYLGDALLVGSGKNPMYAPRLREARVNRALENFNDDPLDRRQSLKELGQVDGAMAANLGLKMDEQAENRALLEARAQDLRERSEGRVHDLAGSLLMSATDQKSYDRVRAIRKRLYEGHGIPEPFELPDSFDEGEPLRRAHVPAKTQATVEGSERRTGIQQSGARERTVIQQSNANARAAASEAGKNVRAEQADKTRRRGQDMRANSSGGIARPKGLPRVIKGRDGRIVVR